MTRRLATPLVPSREHLRSRNGRAYEPRLATTIGRLVANQRTGNAVSELRGQAWFYPAPWGYPQIPFSRHLRVAPDRKLGTPSCVVDHEVRQCDLAIGNVVIDMRGRDILTGLINFHGFDHSSFRQFCDDVVALGIGV
jgi:hypothetical protein